MGYAVSDSIVRADRFRPSGKWYDTIALDMSDFFEEPSIHNAVKKALEKQGHAVDTPGWTIIVLEPYHKHSHPVMIKG